MHYRHELVKWRDVQTTSFEFEHLIWAYRIQLKRHTNIYVHTFLQPKQTLNRELYLSINKFSMTRVKFRMAHIELINCKDGSQFKIPGETPKIPRLKKENLNPTNWWCTVPTSIFATHVHCPYLWHTESDRHCSEITGHRNPGVSRLTRERWGRTRR